MIADLAIHCDEKQHNPHAHVMLTTRELSAGGFGRKVTAWNSRESLVKWRAGCSAAQNEILRRQGKTQALADHRSYKERGVDLEPTFHVGVRGTNIGRKLRRERRHNAGRAFKEPQNAHRAVSSKLDASNPTERQKTASASPRRARKAFERGTVQPRRTMFAAQGVPKTWERRYSDREGLRFQARRNQQADRLKSAREKTREKGLADQFRNMFVNPGAARANFVRYAATKGMRAAFSRLGRKPDFYGTLKPSGRDGLTHAYRMGPEKAGIGPTRKARDRSKDRSHSIYGYNAIDAFTATTPSMPS